MIYILIIGLLIAVLAVQVLLFQKKSGYDPNFVNTRFDSIDKAQERVERNAREEMGKNREELMSMLKNFNDSISRQMSNNADTQNQKLDNLIKSNEQRFDRLQDKVEKKLTHIQQDNTAKLEEMRKTVDEKLQSTLEKRLGESFRLVSERLEKVHEGLGEMQKLATGVGDLQKVLTNVKTRGTWGEIQLENLLEQVLAPGQYEKNVQTKPRSRERVEFAIKLPGKDDKDGNVVWLPIDAKFPKEDYERLIDASEQGNLSEVERASNDLVKRIKEEAKAISEKYLNPPMTTDFGILFLPVEGLYGEVLRKPGLVEDLQKKYRVNIAGPTTLAALLNSLSMGFRTLAIEKRSSEVWKILAAVKKEFGTFGDIINSVKTKLDEASKVIDEKIATRTRVINRKLKNVEILPIEEVVIKELQDDYE